MNEPHDQPPSKDQQPEQKNNASSEKKLDNSMSARSAPSSENQGEPNNPADTHDQDADSGSSTPKTPPAAKTGGWIENLAKRSSGLEEHVTPANASPQDTLRNPAWKYAGLGIQLGLTTALFAWFGYLLDGYMGWTRHQGLLVLSFVAIVGNLYLMIKEAMKENRK